MGKLTKTEIDKLLNKSRDKQLEKGDGNKLYLIVTKIGSCKFKYRIRTQENASWIVIGDYPGVSLNEARQKALEIRAMLANGADPSSIKNKKRLQQYTMQQLIDWYYKERLPLVRIKSADKFKNDVNNDIASIIGRMYVSNVNEEIVYSQVIVPKLNNGSPSVARRNRNNLKVLFDFAIEKGLIATNPVSSIRSSSIYRDKPRSRHLSIVEISQLLRLIYQAQMKTQHKLAFHLSLMLLTRKTELTHAVWSQVDFEHSTFTIKDSKMGSQLLIPLPTQAVQIFHILKDLSQGSEYIFTGRSGIAQPISTTTLNWEMKAINRAMFEDNIAVYCTIHDLRRTGATQLGEMGYPSDWIEVALNHSKGGIKQVYQRSQYIKQRAEMLQTWADKLDELISEYLLPYGKKFII